MKGVLVVMPKKPGEGKLKDAVSFSLTSSAAAMSLPFSIGQAAAVLCKMGGKKLLLDVCRIAGKSFGVAGLAGVFLDAMSKNQDEDGFTERERLDVAVNLTKTGALALGGIAISNPAGVAVVAVISFAFMIMDSTGYTSNQMIIDFFGKLGEAFRNNILDFDPYNPELIMGRLIWEKTQKARSLVDPSSYTYLKNLPLDAQYKSRLFEVLEAAFYMPYVDGPHKKERDGMIQVVKDAIIWAKENGLEDNLDDVKREIEMIESIPSEVVKLNDKLEYIVKHENFGRSPNTKAYAKDRKSTRLNSSHW